MLRVKSYAGLKIACVSKSPILANPGAELLLALRAPAREAVRGEGKGWPTLEDPQRRTRSLTLDFSLASALQTKPLHVLIDRGLFCLWLIVVGPETNWSRRNPVSRFKSCKFHVTQISFRRLRSPH